MINDILLIGDMSGCQDDILKNAIFCYKNRYMKL